MGQVKRDYASAGILIFFCIVGLVHLSSIPFQAALFPRVVLSATILLSVLLIINTYRESAVTEKLWDGRVEIRNFLFFSLVSFGYLILLPVLGFFSSSVLFLPLSSWLLGFRKPRLLAGGTIGFVVLVYVIFVLVFDHPLPEEWWAT